MDEITSKSQMAKIRSFEKGFMAIHLINMGAELGILEALNTAENGITSSDAASKLGLHEPYASIWFQTAYHFEIVDCDEKGRFQFQPHLNEILGDRSSFKNYLANISGTANLGHAMKEVPEYFRSGNKFEVYSTAEFSEGAYETTKNIHLVFLFMIFPKNERLNQLMNQGIRFLDIGCGNGNLITQLAQHFNNCTFVGVNPDSFGIEAAKKKISEMDLEKSVSVINSGAEELTHKEEFDIANMVVTLHEIPPDVRPAAVAKAYDALKPGGCLQILDFPFPGKLEDFRGSVYEYAILDQFYEAPWGVVHLSTDEQEELLTTVGFKDIQRVSIGKGMFEFVTATK
ncbi:MAG: class I SAM-dependent methyltransferase [Deltaproteobacteria bacterium]|jgi:SAM-dependent methyltransferase|nr:class I SAM-dependent methyltransferase [Deltaproteobacteria bacterium]MBT4091096.1 class I SAM-dependent methyltransferase [Deltaproteobacteria bacterium]MBT4269407.1 class I SAM-dependent methyltransferase [Deltaproteobacteria bacterium]MBT4644820.1 class I SAM-dependent methyltransferase [Deltaproteobacteria bacterium]MBT6498290.1 class I SAM-dependent methyltransferase [Deltaproteobacteria bacterium]